jgi:hypothetical protein
VQLQPRKSSQQQSYPSGSIGQSKSSDSSFKRNFNLMLEQNESLKYQYNQIVSKQLKASNHVYSDFIKQMVNHNSTLLSESAKFPKTLPLSRKREDLLQNYFTFDNVYAFMEGAKKAFASHSEHAALRLVPSDQSGQLIQS